MELVWVAILTFSLSMTMTRSEGNNDTAIASTPWVATTPLAHKREMLCAVTVQNYLYAIGGWDGVHMNDLNTVVRTTDGETWNPAPNMSRSHVWPACVATGDGRIFVAGGHVGAFDLKVAGRSVEMLDLASNRWTDVASLWVARSFHGAAVVDGTMFVLGGVGIFQTVLDSVERLDTAPANNATVQMWIEAVPMPTPRAFFAAAVLDDRAVYVCGGQSGSWNTRTPSSSALSSVARFDPSREEWTTLPAAASLPWPRMSHRAIALDARTFVVLGGCANSDCSTVAETAAVFRASGDDGGGGGGAGSWTLVRPRLPTPRFNMGAGVLPASRALVVVGGASRWTVNATTGRLDAKFVLATVDACAGGAAVCLAAPTRAPTAAPTRRLSIGNEVQMCVGGAIALALGALGLRRWRATHARKRLLERDVGLLARSFIALSREHSQHVSREHSRRNSRTSFGASCDDGVGRGTMAYGTMASVAPRHKRGWSHDSSASSSSLVGDATAPAARRPLTYVSPEFGAAAASQGQGRDGRATSSTDLLAALSFVNLDEALEVLPERGRSGDSNGPPLPDLEMNPDHLGILDRSVSPLRAFV